MGWLSRIVGGGGIGDTLGAVGEAAKNIEDVFRTSDREALAQYQAETHRIEVERADRAAQIRVNEAEARHRSMFVAGWRPFVGWVCGLSMCYHFLLFPLLAGPLAEHFDFQLVDLNWQELSVILMGMLGFGGIRAYEKVRGVSSNRVKP